MTVPKKPSPLLHFALWSILGVVVVGFVFGYLYSGLRDGMRNLEHEEALPVNSTVPPFTLTERSGQPVSLDGLKGHIWVADFIFTSCPASCGTMSNRMRELQNALRKTPEIKLVSFTVDPEKDTPEVLRRYAERFMAKPDQWLFLTGPAPVIYDVAHKGFLLGFQQTEGEEAIKFGKYTHSTRFALVDSQGRVRAYHDAFDDKMIDKILADIGNLMREEKSK